MNALNRNNTTVRRLGANEVDEVRKAQKHAPHFAKLYPQHRQWLEVALRDVERGRRIAFGAFTSLADGDGAFASWFLGSMIIKRGTSNVIQAKNLVVRLPNPASVTAHPSAAEIVPGDANTEAQVAARNFVRDRLLEKAEIFCARRGFSRIEMELGAAEQEEIRLLLGNGYKVQSIRESRYRPGDSFYLLSKQLVPIYSGDPFDFLSVSRWLITDRLGWVLDGRPQSHYFAEEIAEDQTEDFCALFNFIVPHHGWRDDATKIFDVRGTCVVDLKWGRPEQFSPVLEEITNSKTELRILLSLRDSGALRSEAEKKRFKFLDRSEILKILGPDSSVSRTRFDVEKVSGVLLDIGNQYRERIVRRATRSEPFAFFISNGIGKILALRNVEDEEPDRSHLALFCSIEAVEGGGFVSVVWGYATIANVDLHPLDSAYGSIPPSMRLWEQGEYDFYLNDITVNFSEAELIAVLDLQGPRLFDKPVRLLDIASDQLSKSLERDFNSVGISTSYIDIETIERLEEKIGAVTTEAPTEPQNAHKHDEYRLDVIFLEVVKVVLERPALLKGWGLDPGEATRCAFELNSMIQKRADGRPNDDSQLDLNFRASLPSLQTRELLQKLRQLLNEYYANRTSNLTGDQQLNTFARAIRKQAAALFQTGRQWLDIAITTDDFLIRLLARVIERPLDNDQRLKFIKAISAAFPTHSALNAVVERLAKNLSNFMGVDTPIDKVISNVVSVAIAGGWCMALLVAARDESPSNLELREFWNELDLGAFP